MPVHDVSGYNEFLEVTGAASDRILTARDKQKQFSSKELLELTSAIVQCIWAEFQGRDYQASNMPKIIIRAIDSTFWEVISDDSEIFHLLEKRFNNTEVIRLAR